MSAAIPFTTPPLPDPERVLSDRWALLQWFPKFAGRLIFGKPLAPTTKEWTHIKASLYQGDAPMDQVVAWMFAGNVRENKALFDQTSSSGIMKGTGASVLKRYNSLPSNDPLSQRSSHRHEAALSSISRA